MDEINGCETAAFVNWIINTYTRFNRKSIHIQDNWIFDYKKNWKKNKPGEDIVNAKDTKPANEIYSAITSISGDRPYVKSHGQSVIMWYNKKLKGLKEEISSDSLSDEEKQSPTKNQIP